MSTKRSERALAQILREARTETAPELDWAALEARLPRGPVARSASAAPRTRLWLAAAAVAAVAGGFAWSRQMEAPSTATRHDGAEGSSEGTSGDRLTPGSSVSTLAEARTIDHPHRASWTLAPNSRATLVTSGDVVVVRLESGSLTARIVPSTRPESFAVEAADVRVAAHGTVFRVTLEGGAVAVAVEEGAVLVGPRATPGLGKRLAGPSAERFTLLGAPAVEPAREAKNRPTQRPGHPSIETAPPASANASSEPLPEYVGEATARAVELASACFRERTSASDGVRVTAHTVLSYRATPEGGIASIRFEPPLAPNVQACIDQGSPKLSVAATPRGFQGSSVVDLER